eukprot:c4618_g1_i1.p1 GENE.c4618_g1_i1~~c4618_g1_i1.p1  ORF type:complete len:196 (-),score=48.22 c4618_g1_i1:95-682(-)
MMQRLFQRGGKSKKRSKVTLKRVKREFRVLMCGLDGAGKTTLLYRMKRNEFVPCFPTIGFNVEMVWVSKKGVHFTMWDVGGGEHIRGLWRYYMSDKQGILFVVDSSDKSRIREARDTLHSLLKEYELRNAFLLIMATKKDRKGAMSKEELFRELDIDAIKNREFFLQMCDSENGEGVLEGLDWLSVKAEIKADAS